MVLKVDSECPALCCCSRLSSVLSSIRLREIPALERDETALDKVLDLGTRTHKHIIPQSILSFKLSKKRILVVFALFFH